MVIVFTRVTIIATSKSPPNNAATAMVIGTDVKVRVQGLSGFGEGAAYKPPCSMLNQSIVGG
jgi:hypothetical protein